MVKKVLLLFTTTAALWLTGVAAQNLAPLVAQAPLTENEQSITGAQPTGTAATTELESAIEEIADVLEAIDGIDPENMDVIDNQKPNPTPTPPPSIWDTLNFLNLYLLVELDVVEEKIKEHYNQHKKVYMATAGATTAAALAYLVYWLYQLHHETL